MVKTELQGICRDNPHGYPPPPASPAPFPQLEQGICHFTPVLPALLSTLLMGAEARPAPLQLGFPALPRTVGFCAFTCSCSPGEDVASLHP